jgi:hypothetical protein
MTRFISRLAALPVGLLALLASGRALAATEPAVPAPATEPAAPSAPEVVTPPAAPSSPEATPASAAPQAGPPAATTTSRPIRLKTEAPPRDNYGGPPLLLGNGKNVKVGAYGGMGGAYTRFMGRDSGLVSLEAALLLDHRLSLGLAAYGFTRTPRGPAAADGTKQEFGAGYVGFAARYSIFGNLPVYPTFGVVLGAGAINLHHDHGWDDDSDWDDGLRYHDDDDDDEWERGLFDPFLFVQPELALNANATRWLRFGATVGYRFTSGVGRFGLDTSDMNGIVAGGNVQLGWF